MARTSRRPSPCIEDWNAWAVPWKVAAMVAGNVARASFSTSSVAGPRDTPGARLNESVTDGTWPEWLTVIGPTPALIRATESSGTSSPAVDRT